MFSYVDERIRRRLEETGRLRTIGEGAGHPISLLGPIPLPVTDPGTGEEHVLRWYPFVRRTELMTVHSISDELKKGRPDGFMRLVSSYMCVNSILIHGEAERAPSPLVRVHSCCMTGDVFGSMRCECGPQLEEAFARIFCEGAGIVVYMASHEGRGIGLWAKGVTYILQDMGQDTYQANESLGLPADSRDFTDASVVLGEFVQAGAGIRLLTNNPMKVDHLVRGGVTVAEKIPLVTGINPHNTRYLQSKRDKGHAIDLGK